jgi:hypothetical protein
MKAIAVTSITRAEIKHDAQEPGVRTGGQKARIGGFSHSAIWLALLGLRRHLRETRCFSACTARARVLTLGSVINKWKCSRSLIRMKYP